MGKLNQNIIVAVFAVFFVSCNSLDEKVNFNCFGGTFVLFENFNKVADSLSKMNIDLEYNDSFSGESRGVTMYSYQEEKGSLIIENSLFFESKKLKGLSFSITSMEINDQDIFLKKIRDEIHQCIPLHTNLFRIDTSANIVNILESNSGQIFHLKVYDNILHKKIPFVF